VRNHIYAVVVEIEIQLTGKDVSTKFIQEIILQHTLGGVALPESHKEYTSKSEQEIRYFRVYALFFGNKRSLLEEVIRARNRKNKIKYFFRGIRNSIN
jgi:hypothetical protein